jgi:hypothetical protein
MKNVAKAVAVVALAVLMGGCIFPGGYGHGGGYHQEYHRY